MIAREVYLSAEAHAGSDVDGTQQGLPLAERDGNMSRHSRAEHGMVLKHAEGAQGE